MAETGVVMAAQPSSYQNGSLRMIENRVDTLPRKNHDTGLWPSPPIRRRFILSLDPLTATTIFIRRVLSVRV